MRAALGAGRDRVLMSPRVAILGGGMAGLEAAVFLASDPRVQVEVIERGPNLRTEHIEWDTTVYPGDEKTQRWTSTGWGAGGGLSERLGGRSLCYHGVCLGIESEALADWPQEWTALLTGGDGAYVQVRESLAPHFPELQTRQLSEAATKLGLKHVPQAAYFDDETRRLRAYSPLSAALRLVETGDALRILQGAAHRLRRGRDGRWSVDVHDAAGNTYTRDGFHSCILASSAIVNVTLLGQALEHELTTQITDHFCAGALVRLSPGDSLDTFRHRKLWSGYIELPSLSTNVFIQEMAPLPDGDRMVEVFAVIEQGRRREDYSQLTVNPNLDGESSQTYIEGRVSATDRERLERVRQEVLTIANRIAQGALDDVTDERVEPEPPPHRRDPMRGREDDRWLAYENALQALIDQPAAGKLAQFDFPYGSFEHEACTHPIGANGLLTVTTDLAVRELPGVHVAGPGNFVRPGAANPALTILAMSRLLADAIRARYS